MGPGNVQEATPLVYNGVMYLPNPSDLVQALDARTGDLLWQYQRKLPADLGKFGLRDQPQPRDLWGQDRRHERRRLRLRLGRETGALAWETKILDYQKGAQQTSGPIIANGKIISGRGCEPEGGPDACVITAHDAVTGKEIWRTRTIPRPGEPGYETWGDVPEEKRIHVGTWMVPSYDPQLNMVYIGTSVTSPAPKVHAGRQRQTLPVLQLDAGLNADTGKIGGHFAQHLVDHWISIIRSSACCFETSVAPDPKQVAWINPKIKPGEKRRVITGIPGKTGIVYTLDRRTGEFLWARPTVQQNVIRSIDGATGAVTGNPDMLFTAKGQEKLICPSVNGGKNWPAGAYSPDQRDVPPTSKHVHESNDAGSDVCYARSDAAGARGRHRQGRDRVRDFGRNRTHVVELYAARRHSVVGGDRRA